MYNPGDLLTRTDNQYQMFVITGYVLLCVRSDCIEFRRVGEVEDYSYGLFGFKVMTDAEEWV